MDAKAEILERIRLAAVTPSNVEPKEIVRSTRPRHEIIEQFAEYVAEYRATVIRSKASELSEAIHKQLDLRGSSRVVIPSDLESGWCENCIRDANFSHRELNEFQAVVTACALGIAETGTFVLDCGPGQGRRVLSLIPDHHICVIREDQIVDSMPEAVAQLADAVKDGRPLTWISGPSATSDIELSRVEGVHGPRVLDVIIVAEA